MEHVALATLLRVPVREVHLSYALPCFYGLAKRRYKIYQLYIFLQLQRPVSFRLLCGQSTPAPGRFRFRWGSPLSQLSNHFHDAFERKLSRQL